MLKYIDCLNRTVLLNNAPPKRIISLVPSQSEFLFDIGLRNELIGITKFCVRPKEMFDSVIHIGGTKNLNLEKIRELKPDLIIGNKEENEQNQIEILEKEFPVWLSDIYTFDDAFNMMKNIGSILNKEKETNCMVDEINASLQNTKDIFAGKRTAYFIWNNPYMCAAKNTFIHSVLTHLGFDNVFKDEERYPQVSEEYLQKLNPEICLLSSEPFPFKEQHLKALQEILPHSKIVIVDGEIFSWYGSRLLQLEAYVRELKLLIETA